MLNIIISGLPGSGKGTQSEKLKDHYPELTYIQTGAILRNASEKETEVGKKAKEYMERGALVPDEMVNTIVSEYIDENIEQTSGFIFDGYPRTIQQAEFLDKDLEKHETEIHYFIYLYVSEEELIRRMQSRGREDDKNQEVMRNRMEQQKKRLFPIKEHYERNNKVREIDGERTIESIFNEIMKVLE